MNQNQRPINDAQLRLLLPSSWIEELDTVAKVKFKSRLGLIRHYLRLQLDHDLLNLQEHFRRRDEIRRAKLNTDQWLHEKEDDDQW